MTVSEKFTNEKIDLDFMDRKFDGPYWTKAKSFLRQIWNANIAPLTDKEQAWMEKILADAIERRLKSNSN